MNKELEKYVDLIMSMSLEVKMDGISEETYLYNLEIMLQSIKEKYDNGRKIN